MDPITMATIGKFALDSLNKSNAAGEASMANAINSINSMPPVQAPVKQGPNLVDMMIETLTKKKNKPEMGPFNRPSQFGE